MSSEFTFEPVGYVDGIVEFYVPSIFSPVGEDGEADVFETSSGITLQVDIHYWLSPEGSSDDPRFILDSVLAEVVERSKPVLLNTGFGFSSYVENSDCEGLVTHSAHLCCAYSPGKVVALLFSVTQFEGSSPLEVRLAFHAVRQLARWTQLHKEQGADESYAPA